MPIALPRHAELWLPGYLRAARTARRESLERRGTVDILFAITDHYEPLGGHASVDVGRRRVARWVEEFPALVSDCVDADGRPPQHTFFYPIEEYRPNLVEPLAGLCERGFGEVEVHLHHDGDTADHLRDELTAFTRTLRDRHGLLPSDPSGSLRYAFIHGNWALSNALPGGRSCGVDDELAVLRDTGCYADMTMPAAPSAAQSRTVNQIYYAVGAARGPRAHDAGVRAAVGRPASPSDLLLVQGPLAPHFRGAKWGVLPRLENGELEEGARPSARRFADWVSCGVSVRGRPEWVFVKVHAHGAREGAADVLLGPAMAAFHRDVLARWNDGQRYRLHYVTAREMVNIIHAAEDGKTGNAGQYRDHRYLPPPRAVRVASPTG
jgi:hypothetical protein